MYGKLATVFTNIAKCFKIKKLLYNINVRKIQALKLGNVYASNFKKLDLEIYVCKGLLLSHFFFLNIVYRCFEKKFLQRSFKHVYHRYVTSIF